MSRVQIAISANQGYLFYVSDKKESGTLDAIYFRKDIHRLNGPCVCLLSPHKKEIEWWVHEVYFYDPKMYFDILDELGVDINNISDSDKLLIRIKLQEMMEGE